MFQESFFAILWDQDWEKDIKKGLFQSYLACTNTFQIML